MMTTFIYTHRCLRVDTKHDSVVADVFEGTVARNVAQRSAMATDRSEAIWPEAFGRSVARGMLGGQYRISGMDYGCNIGGHAAHTDRIIKILDGSKTTDIASPTTKPVNRGIAFWPKPLAYARATIVMSGKLDESGGDDIALNAGKMGDIPGVL